MYGSKTWLTKVDYEVKSDRTEMSRIRWIRAYVERKNAKLK